MLRGGARRGATKAEYALVLGLLSVSAVLVVGALGEGVGGLFDGIVVFDPHDGRGSGGDDGGGAGAGGGGGGGGDDTDDSGGKGKGNRGNNSNNGGHGNPGQGNAGNDKSVGNSK